MVDHSETLQFQCICSYNMLTNAVLHSYIFCQYLIYTYTSLLLKRRNLEVLFVFVKEILVIGRSFRNIAVSFHLLILYMLTWMQFYIHILSISDLFIYLNVFLFPLVGWLRRQYKGTRRIYDRARLCWNETFSEETTQGMAVQNIELFS